MQQSPYVWNGLPVASDWAHITQSIYQTKQKLQQLSDRFNQLQQQMEKLNKRTPLHVNITLTN